MIGPQNTFAQNEIEYLNMASSNYQKGLQSQNNSIVMASLINVMKMHDVHSVYNFEAICLDRDSLSQKDATKEIQLMARLAGEYYHGANDLSWITQL